MRKYKLLVMMLLIAVSIFLISCIKDEKEDDQDTGVSYSTISALKIVNNYFRYLKNNDYESIKKICTEDMLKNNKIEGKSDLNVISYMQDKVLELNDYSIFNMKVESISNKEPYALLEEYRIYVMKSDEGYKISEIRTSPNKEIFVKQDKIKIRNKNDSNTNVLIYMEDIPNFITTKQDKMKINKYSVPKKHFGSMSISYDGLNAAISTYDNNSYIAIVSIDESLTLQSGKKQGVNNESNGKSQQGNISDIIEVPIGKQIFSLDLINNSQVDFMVFSPQQRFLVVQYRSGDKFKCIRVYDTKKMEIIPVSFEEAFPLNEVDVVFNCFEENSLYFEVEAKTNISFDEKDIIGKYKLNLENFTISKE